ncbi:DUF1934 domain-containing protein [Apilactobacillus xinyiensis]|jgi:uncharacterized beta-barrel protein YwiB (DUF1934 family)|uniref:DUF1934 domain-containing protein n=1 Tax=Apilactobacillus xinyiensis TaxID=2841032 RepID=A0ABT0I350_9LACO|nr:DUF1934 domain-containing protein [Apilactobacillus xinyiensis]MCK8625124.1 DUF1934 domain-containing protein [Apilactobacillus xinyiensis]MCL0312865.1 DUF1934 domain-containing protein [Apilactobacillus xinyiensis]MCL0319277.1 DUF1934 domain-containing protein [Apilactobacillus xinyiensis]MCL0330463.1 DUF1934 domain-containing protein [Apilactobacillus xinyiensis]
MHRSRNQQVRISLKTQIEQNNEVNDFNFDVIGSIVQIEDSLYIRYNENNDVTVPVTIKIPGNDQDVQLTRKAAGTHTKLFFNKNKVIPTKYETPYGKIDIRVFTSKLEFTDKKEYGNLSIDYIISDHQDILGRYKIRLQFTA